MKESPIPTHITCHAVAVVPYISIYSANGSLVFFSSVNRLHCVGVTGSYEGDEEVAVFVRETESMHKFQIILDFQLILRGSITVRLYVD